MDKFLWRFDQISPGHKVTWLWIQHMQPHTCECIKIPTLVVFALFVSFMERTPTIIKFYGVFYHFLQTSQVTKFWTIKLYLYVNDVIHTNDQTKFANCGLHVKHLEFSYNVTLFQDEKGSFEAKVVILASDTLQGASEDVICGTVSKTMICWFNFETAIPNCPVLI